MCGEGASSLTRSVGSVKATVTLVCRECSWGMQQCPAVDRTPLPSFKGKYFQITYITKRNQLAWLLCKCLASTQMPVAPRIPSD